PRDRRGPRRAGGGRLLRPGRHADRRLLGGGVPARSLASGRMRARDLAAALLSTARFQLGRLGFSGLIAATAACLRDVPEQELDELAERIFARTLAAAIYPESRALVQAHRRCGHTLAVVSSAT